MAGGRRTAKQEFLKDGTGLKEGQCNCGLTNAGYEVSECNEMNTVDRIDFDE